MRLLFSHLTIEEPWGLKLCLFDWVKCTFHVRYSFKRVFACNSINHILTLNYSNKLNKFVSRRFLPYSKGQQIQKCWAASWQNQQSGMCAQRRLRSTWASTQHDQSLRCALTGKLRTQAYFMQTAKTLIRLGGCPGWSESSLGAHAILLVLS